MGSARRDPEEREPAARRAGRASPANGAVVRLLPPGYHLDVSDPDILFLRRPDGRIVAAFSARGATHDGIAETAWADYRGREEGRR